MAYEVPFLPQATQSLLNPLDVQEKGFQLGQQQLQAKRQTQEYEQAQASQKALREAFQTADTSTPEGQADLIRKVGRIDPKAAMALQGQFLTQQKTTAELGEIGARTKKEEAATQKTQADLAADKRETMTGFLGDANQALSNISQVIPDKTILPGSPTYKDRMDRANRMVDEWSGIMKTKYGDSPEIQGILQKIDSHDWQTPDEFRNHLAAYQKLQAMAKQAAPLTNVGKANAAAQSGEITEKQRDALIAKETAPTQTQIQISQPAPPAAEGVEGEEYLKKLPEQERSLVKGIAEGRVNPTTLSTKGGHRERIMEMVTHYDPTYTQSRPAVWKDFTSGKTATNITAINTAIGHLGSVDRLAKGLNQNKLQAENEFINWARTATGDPNINNFEIARDAVGNELMRVFRQVGASENETKEWEARFAAKMSPEQLKGAVATAVDLLHSRIDAIQDTWHRGAGTEKDFPNLLSPKSKEILNRLEEEKSPSAKPAQAYSDPDKEKRYQEWKKAHGG